VKNNPDPGVVVDDGSRRARRKWVGHGLSNRFIYRGTAWGCVHLPLRVLYAISAVLNSIAIVLMRETKAAVRENFRMAFGCDEKEARRLTRGLFHAYGRTTVDLFRIRSAGAALAPPITTFERDEAILRGLLAGGRGCLIVTGHVGNWEMGAVTLGAHGVRGAVVGQAELDPEIQALRIEIRSKLGVESIDIGGTMATAFRVREAIDRGMAVAIAADRAYEDDHVMVQYFGRETPFLKSPALLARFCSCPILPSFFLRNDDGSYRSFFGEPIHPDLAIPPEEDARRMMSAVARVVEQAVREAPSQWFNFFPYWTTPLGGH